MQLLSRKHGHQSKVKIKKTQMNEQDFKIMEIFAYYGRALFMAQCVEKGIMNIIIYSHHDNKITKTRIDELLYEKSKLTLGQLKREIQNSDAFSDTEREIIEEFHKKRDFLTHSYWWERAVEFADDKLEYNFLQELTEYTTFFEKINFIIENKYFLINKEHKINFKTTQDILMAYGKTIPIESFRELTKNETVLDIFGYKNANQSIIPLFQLQDKTNWTVCERGLTQYKEELDELNIEPIKELEGIFPINQFNPRPKIIAFWNYELDLKQKGLKMIISRGKNDLQFKWKIKKVLKGKKPSSSNETPK